MNYKVLENLQTKVHPLNKKLLARVHDKALIITERDPLEIRFLTYNIQMIPKALASVYNAGY